MSIKPILLSDVQTNDLVYYDPKFEKECLSFCQRRDIDCLPSLTDPMKFYRKSGSSFEERKVLPDQIVDEQMQIFDPLLLDKFSAYRLLFVMNHNHLSGVIHFSDYNKPVVHTYLYYQISTYERSLRKLLEDNGKKNQDMLEYYQAKIEASSGKNQNRYKRNLNSYLKNQEENEKLTPFECFYLLDLIELADHCDVIKLNTETNELRNQIMHAHELVLLADRGRQALVYTLSSFTQFFNRALNLLKDCKRVNNRIALAAVRGTE